MHTQRLFVEGSRRSVARREEGGGGCPPVGAVVEAQRAQQAGRHRAARAPRQPAQSGVQAQHLAGGELRGGGVVLGAVARGAARRGGRARAGGAAHKRGPRVGGLLPGQHPKRGGFAGPVLAQQPKALPRDHRQPDAAHGGHGRRAAGAVGAAHAVEQHGGCGGRGGALLDGPPLGGDVLVLARALTLARLRGCGARLCVTGASGLAAEATPGGRRPSARLPQRPSLCQRQRRPVDCRRHSKA
jgi:hypothetical protein